MVVPVKGRDTFASAEIAKLRRLIQEKQTAGLDRQKQLRAQMRRIGFYITDFCSDQRGFTVEDLDELIERGKVRVSDRNEEPGRDIKQLPPEPSDPDDRSQLAGKGEEAAEARLRRKKAAARYRPPEIELLLVAEAPPRELDRYFYFEHVPTQDSLFRYVSRCLLEAEPTRGNKRRAARTAKGPQECFSSICRKTRETRRRLAEFVPGLAERCRKLAPARIVLIKATVFDAAHSALKTARLPVSDVRVPFPGTGQQKRFVEAFTRAINSSDTSTE